MEDRRWNYCFEEMEQRMTSAEISTRNDHTSKFSTIPISPNFFLLLCLYCTLWLTLLSLGSWRQHWRLSSLWVGICRLFSAVAIVDDLRPCAGREHSRCRSDGQGNC